MRRAVVLVDGEHYPPVTMDAIRSLSAEFDVVAAAFCGGGEKLRGALVLGDLPVVTGPTAVLALSSALDRFMPEVVVDCSDAPVVDARTRFALASLALSRGAQYRGAGFVFDAPARPKLSSAPAIAVIGTGKRTGKTAVSAALARHVAAKGMRVVIVAMGRGGPAEPVVTHGETETLDARELLARADRGEHAATDAYEDAVMARVTTVGARRAGAGLAGQTLHDTVAAAVARANEEKPDLVILEGSGTAVPPAHADATILVAPHTGPAETLREGLAGYRLLISDLVVVTMSIEPVLPTETLSASTSQLSELVVSQLAEFARDVPIARTVLRPTPLQSVAGKKVFFATTAPEAAGPALQEHLERAHGAVVVGRSHKLANREGLALELTAAEGTYEVLLTELKATAIDVGARIALAAGAEVVFCDNRPDGLGAAFDEVCARAGV